MTLGSKSSLRRPVLDAQVDQESVILVGQGVGPMLVWEQENMLGLKVCHKLARSHTLGKAIQRRHIALSRHSMESCHLQQAVGWKMVMELGVGLLAPTDLGSHAHRSFSEWLVVRARELEQALVRRHLAYGQLLRRCVDVVEEVRQTETHEQLSTAYRNQNEMAGER